MLIPMGSKNQQIYTPPDQASYEHSDMIIFEITDSQVENLATESVYVIVPRELPLKPVMMMGSTSFYSMYHYLLTNADVST